MITKQDFISKIHERDRLSSRAALALGILMVTAVFGMSLLDYAKTHGHLGWAGNVNVMKVCSVLWIVAFFSVVVGLIVVNVGRRGVFCPHCKKQLQSIPAQITVATGFCGFCGEQVFELPFRHTEQKG